MPAVLFCEAKKHRHSALFLVCQHKNQAAFDAQFAVDFSFGIDKECQSAFGCDFASHFDGVAGAHLVFEAHFVHAGIEGEASGQLFKHQRAAALSHDFAQYHPWHNGVAGEVALKEIFVATHVVVSDGGVAFHGDIIDEQHRLAVRQIFFNFFSCHNNL